MNRSLSIPNKYNFSSSSISTVGGDLREISSSYTGGIEKPKLFISLGEIRAPKLAPFYVCHIQSVLSATSISSLSLPPNTYRLPAF